MYESRRLRRKELLILIIILFVGEKGPTVVVVQQSPLVTRRQNHLMHASTFLHLFGTSTSTIDCAAYIGRFSS